MSVGAWHMVNMSWVATISALPYRKKEGLVLKSNSINTEAYHSQKLQAPVT